MMASTFHELEAAARADLTNCNQAAR